MPMYYYIAAVLVVLLIGSLRKDWKIGLLIGYMVILFSSMVLNRRTSISMLTRIAPFSTLRSFPKLSNETWVNIIAFIPIGLLCGKRWRGVFVGLCFSLFIEMAQILDVSLATLQRYEDGKAVVPLDVAERVAGLYNMTLVEFFEGVEDVSPGEMKKQEFLEEVWLAVLRWSAAREDKR